MAAIDDKMRALNFTATTARTPDEVASLLDDAATVAQGEKILLTRTTPQRIDGKARNFVRVTHAAFAVTLTPGADGGTTVRLSVGDYLRTRSTLMYVIPISPWSAPAYKTISQFCEYVRAKL